MDATELRERFRVWLGEATGSSATVGPLVAPGHGGLSNRTLVVEANWGEGVRLVVLRLPPEDPGLFPRYDPAGEAALLRALGRHTAIPVPEVLWVEPDDAPLGAPFFVMAHVAGRVPPDRPGYQFEGWVSELSPSEQAHVLESGLRALAAVHGADHTSLTAVVPPLGPGETPLAREVRAWRTYLQWAAQGERVELVADALEHCATTRPPERSPIGLVWGDARLGNLVYSDDLTVAAVLDWEMATIGPAELDIGWYLFLERVALQFTAQLPGFADRAGTVARYEQLAARELDDLDWYETWGGVRAACIQVRMAELLSDRGRLAARSWRETNPVAELLHATVTRRERHGP